MLVRGDLRTAAASRSWAKMLCQGERHLFCLLGTSPISLHRSTRPDRTDRFCKTVRSCHLSRTPSSDAGSEEKKTYRLCDIVAFASRPQYCPECKITFNVGLSNELKSMSTAVNVKIWVYV